jgi:hypothetical protein
VLRFDGETWTRKTLGTNTRLFSVSAAAPDDVWFGGELGRLYRWQGSAITPVQSGTTEPINALRAFENGALAAGQNGGILRYLGP